MNLGQIETRLQALIESSVALFARGDAQLRLAHQLVDAVEKNLRTAPDGRAIAPDLFIIYLHPEIAAYWTEHRPQLTSIGNSLRDVTRENGVTFLHDPEIRLAPDPHMAVEGIRVEVGEIRETSGHTAAFSAASAEPRSGSAKNAFLIVEGNRVFPLNRSVINIGRRSDNQLVLPDPRVSRSHAQIRAVRGQYVLFDLNSTGGTMVNGRRIHQCALKPGDVISLSGVPLIYGEEAPDDDIQETGFTRSMNSPKNEPPEIIE